MEDFLKLLEAPLIITVVTVLMNLLVDYIKTKINKNSIERERKIPLQLYLVGQDKYVVQDYVEAPEFDESGSFIGTDYEEQRLVYLNFIITNDSQVESSVYNVYLECNNLKFQNIPNLSRTTASIKSQIIPFPVPASTTFNIWFAFDISDTSIDENTMYSLHINSTNGHVIYPFTNPVINDYRNQYPWF